MALKHPDLVVETLPGNAFHEYLAEARATHPVTPANLFGASALLITGFEELRAFFAAADEFPPGAMYQLFAEPAVGRTFISMDGPPHDLYRQLAMPAFRSRATARFVEHDLTPLAHEVIDRFAALGHGDLAAELAQVLPFWAISRKLGLPLGTEERQRKWALALLSYPVDPDAALSASAEVTRFLEPIVEERRRRPSDDVLSHLLTAEHQGVRLNDEEVFSHVRLLYAVGATTTSDAMSNLLWALLSRPELVERAKSDPGVRPKIVHELLRWEPPVALLPRLAPNGGRIADVEVPEGSIVVAGIAAANRDPAIFTDADRFDLDRPQQEILSFGFGSKYCPGSHLARQQLGTVLDVLLERLPGLRLVDAAEPSGAILRRVERLVAEWDTA